MRLIPVTTRRTVNQIYFLRFKIKTNSDKIYNFIIWSSYKQLEVSYSLFGPEILAAADANDRGFNLKKIPSSFFPRKKSSITL